jgi:hypothetical protein
MKQEIKWSEAASVNLNCFPSYVQFGSIYKELTFLGGWLRLTIIFIDNNYLNNIKGYICPPYL